MHLEMHCEYIWPAGSDAVVPRIRTRALGLRNLSIAGYNCFFIHWEVFGGRNKKKKIVSCWRRHVPKTFASLVCMAIRPVHPIKGPNISHLSKQFGCCKYRLLRLERGISSSGKHNFKQVQKIKDITAICAVY